MYFLQSSPSFFTIIIIFFILYLFYNLLRRGKKSCEPTNYPIIGMIPVVVQQVNRCHDYITQVLNECGGTYEFKGPWLCNINMVFTSDPANIHHVFSRNFNNYPKGPEFRKMFEILGDGIFNADFELWEFHRNTTRSLLNHGEFDKLLEKTVWGKIERGLIPVLDRFSDGETIDLQDVFQRFAFDTICELVLDFDPKSLSLDMPRIRCEKAFSDVAESLLFRHVIPEIIWRLMNYLRIGTERKLVESWKAFDEFVYPKVKEDLCVDEGKGLNFMGTFKKGYTDRDEKVKNAARGLKDFLRDTSVNLMFAGRDTTSTCLTWLFWLLCKNPASKIKIIEELKEKLGSKWRFFTAKESNKLIYLHGALLESLRLFPPVALEHKSPIKADVLPSGHNLPANSKLIFSFYSVGRSESVWGKDCLEFRPERWISSKGGSLLHEPSYKFPAFNAGPRTCLGKEMAFVEMKMVASIILYRYEVELVEGQKVCPKTSVIIQAKHGLKVRLSKRQRPF